MKRLLLGPHAVEEALRAAAGRVAVVYHDAELRSRSPVLQLAERAGVRCEALGRTQLDALVDGRRHQGLVAIAGDYPYRSLEEVIASARPAPLLLALDQITDPHNFGAIVRSAVALGADGVVTLRERACPVTAAVVRVSAGATEQARIARVTNLANTLARLANEGMQVVGLDAAAGDTLDALPYPAAGRVLVVGSEGRGLRRRVREHCTTLARIELRGPIASLNASVAAAIAIHASMRVRPG
jgi:23S rRNA (guanosine2251-2'-O)-methyltransferase